MRVAALSVEIALAYSTLRPWRRDDLDALVRHADDPLVAENLVDAFPNPYTEEAGRRWLGMREADGVVRHFAIVIDGEPRGGIGLELGTDIRRRSAELGYWLSPPYWGRGVMTEAVIAVTDYGFATFDLEHIFAGLFVHNGGSARVLEKAGFVLEGRLRRHVTKHGVTTDDLIYGIVRDEAHSRVDSPSR